MAPADSAFPDNGSLPTKGPAETRYTELLQDRAPYLDRARRCAELTIPCAFRAVRQVQARPAENIERVTRRLTGDALAREQVIPAMIERIKRLFEGT